MGDRRSGSEKHEVYLALGSNLGDRERYLNAAIDSLQKKGIQIFELSPVYETKAVGYVDQPDFLNMVVRGCTHLSPTELLARMMEIENEQGRIRDKKWGPRTLDLDILFYGKLVLDNKDLTVPHPRMQERAFVLFPLNDLAPELVHPVLGLTVKEMAEQAPGKEGVRRWEKPLANGCVHIES